jgi:hypothetical protein
MGLRNRGITHGNLFRSTANSPEFVSKKRSRIKCSLEIGFVVGSMISTEYNITSCDPEMADTSIYHYPSPLKGFENLEPLSECAN